MRCPWWVYEVQPDPSLIEHYFLKRFVYLLMFRWRGREEKERERNINMWEPLKSPLLGNMAHNPGICPDWESNQQPFGSQASAQSTEPHESGL